MLRKCRHKTLRDRIHTRGVRRQALSSALQSAGASASLSPSAPAANPGDEVQRHTDGIQVVDEDFRVTAVNESVNSLAARPIQIGARCYEACFSGAGRCEPCAELGEMAARIAHEVRNPLNAITGAAHFLASEFPESDTIQNFTSLIKRQSTRVDRVASDLLSASKPLRLTKTSVRLNDAVEQAMAFLCEQVYRQGVKVESRLSSALPLIQADELQIEQALHNIIKNAVEAMPSGGTLRLGTEPISGGAWVMATVEDSGAGISEEDRERIFHSFYTTKLKGTGLGLSIVEGVLKNHCGKILIERGTDSGARVIICLPVRTGEGGSRPSCDHIQCPGGKLAVFSPEPNVLSPETTL